MARRPFIGANIKMNDLPSDLDAYRRTQDTDVVIFPSALDLQTCMKASLAVGAQCGRADEKGAFTGDISMAMLKKIGVTHVLCGHSEHRKFHGETDQMIAKQVEAAIQNGLTPILCIGETEEQHKAGETTKVLQTQLSIVLQSTRYPLTATRSLIAYEPVWAIGTGKTPTVAEIQSTHAFIRSLLPDQAIRILYGGSVKAENAKEIFACDDVDGGLIGGASLDPNGFAKIVLAAGSSTSTM